MSIPTWCNMLDITCNPMICLVMHMLQLRMHAPGVSVEVYEGLKYYRDEDEQAAKKRTPKTKKVHCCAAALHDWISSMCTCSGFEK